MLINMFFDGNQKQSDLMREIEAFGAELKKSRDELEKNHLDVSLHIFVCFSDYLQRSVDYSKMNIPFQGPFTSFSKNLSSRFCVSLIDCMSRRIIFGFVLL